MKIDQTVMTVLSTVECSGNRAVIVDQLDRKLYAKVNEVLVALGGKWNRSAKAHVFASDAMERIDEAILMGEVTTHADIGFFPTPPALAAELVRMAKVGPGMFCLEPSAGTGNIAKAMRAVGGSVRVFERDPKMCVALEEAGFGGFPCDDFMGVYKLTFDVGNFDRIVMNPPFCKVGLGDHLDHAQLAYRLLVDGGILVCVLPNGVQFRGDRRHTKFREWVQEIGGQITDLPALSFRASGTDVNTCVLFVQKRAS